MEEENKCNARQGKTKHTQAISTAVMDVPLCRSGPLLIVANGAYIR